MRIFACLLTMVSFIPLARGQQTWVTRIGGAATCEASAVAVGPDGAVYAGGSWRGTGTNGTDMYLVKLNKATGDTLWTRYYRSANYDRVSDIALTSDGGVVAAGQANNQFTVLHYRADGTVRRVWYDTQHLTSGSYAQAICVDESDASYVTGNGNDLGSSYNIYTMKFSSAGDSVWAQTYAPATALADLAYDIAVDGAHNCYIAGVSGSHIFTMKLTAAGDTAWTRRFHGPGAGSDAGYAVALDRDGNVYVAGETSISGRLAACVISYSPAGTLRFARTYSSPANLGDSFSDVAVDRDGNVVATGTGRTSTYLQSVLVAKYSSDGDSLWAKSYRLSTADASQGWRLALDTAGTIYVAAQSRTGDYDITTLGYGASGTPVITEQYTGSGSYDDWARDIAVGDSGRVLVAGTVSLSSGYTDFTVICYTHLATSAPPGGGAPSLCPHLMQNFPNPFNPATRLRYEIPAGGGTGDVEVRLAVFDLLGREVALLVRERKPPGSYEMEFDAAGLPSGGYFCRLTVGSFAQVRKMILVR